MAAKSTVTLDHISKYYGPIRAVHDVTFELRPGDFLGLIGHNGAGKTTTLQMIVGMVRPTGGNISVCGVDLGTNPQKAREYIGYVPEFVDLYEYLTGVEYLRFIAEVRQMSDFEARGRILALCQMLELEEESHRLIHTYSQGMRRKIAVAAAMLSEPAVLILDEAMNGLDPGSAAALKTELQRLAEKGTMIVLSSHALDMIAKICNRAVIMVRGRVGAVLDHAELVARDGAPGGLEQYYLRLIAEGTAERN